ncbi:hypothetical protein [Deinococcus roseus]|uniref:Uncharacterized protein n=1 Tax=Deinococcus roseus TaxID=392414 RepID=A0ABQ2D1I9_9DEIO|nr:hypothetical protein [Deinococcus roseus]GGJ37319.1 hypothetical protein GCM10008938_24270 [Deinococcus roseus]
MTEANQTSVRIQTLGKLTINQKVVKQSRPLELVVFLATCQGDAARELVENALFGEEASSSAMSNLVQRARGLGFEIQSIYQRYELRTPVVVDAIELERTLKAGDLERSVQLYGGPFFPQSVSPFAEDLRGYFEENLIQLALNQQDSRLMFDVMKRVGMDPRLGDAILASTTQNMHSVLCQAPMRGLGWSPRPIKAVS